MSKPLIGRSFVRTSPAFAVASFVLSSFTVACQPPPSAPTAEPPSQGDVGSVSLSLSLGSTFQFRTVHYDITGNGFHAAADVNVENSTTFATTVGAIPFGRSYVAKLTAQEVDHKLMPCEGATVFDLTSAVPVPVTVHMACRELEAPSVPLPRGAVIALGLLLGALGLARVDRRRAAPPQAGAFFVLGVALAANLGCVPAPEPAEVGGVGVSLQVAPGVTLDAFTYAITGPSAFSRTGTIDTSHSSTATALISALPVGTGYAITLESTATDGMTHCAGAAPFTVTAETTTDVVVHVLCQEAPRSGTVLIGGTLNVCPVAEGVNATMVEGSGGAAWVLTAAAHDLDVGPGPLVYTWAAPAGATLNDAHAPHPTLTCTVTGLVDVTVTVGDGDCLDSTTTQVACHL